MRRPVKTAVIVVSVLFAYALGPVHLLGQFGQRPGLPPVRSHVNPSPRANQTGNAKQKPLHALENPLAAPQKPPVIGFGGSNPIFPTGLSYSSGGLGANSVAAGDFNGDGIPDLAVANYCADSNCTSSSVSILLGNGDGTFQQAVSYNTGAYEALAIAVGDVSQDGKLDIVVTNYCTSYAACGQGQVSVLLGNGDGTFQAPILNYLNGYAGNTVAIGDVNGDGFPDLVVAEAYDTSFASGYVGVLYGNGNGTFEQEAIYASGGLGTYSLALADIDGDGKLDVVAANSCLSSQNCTVGSVSVLLGKNGLQETEVYAVGGNGTYSVALSDVNGDGKLDIAVANHCQSSAICTTGSVSVLLGNGDGSFQPAASYDVNGYESDWVAVNDVNGDGKPDLLVANDCLSLNGDCTTGGVDVLLGNGDGTFQSAVSYSSGGFEAGSIAVYDVNGDSKPDVLVANFNDDNAFCDDGSTGRIPAFGTCTNEGSVAVLLGNGDGTFQTDTNYQTAAAGAYSVAAGDFNGDGIPDLAISNQTSPNQSNGSVAVFLGTGNGAYGQPVIYSSAGLTTSGVATGDFNGDHILDLVLVDQCSDSKCSGGSVSILLGNGDGTFGTASEYLTGSPLSDWVAVGDFNGDGKLDLVVANSCGATCGTVSVLLGNGDGSFQTAQTYASGGIEANFVAVGDFNGDKKLDVAAASSCADGSCTTGGLVGILLGNGDGTFQSAVGYASGGFGAQSLAIGDLNGDGKQDLAVADVSSVPGSIGILLGNGDGSFQPAQTFPVDGQPYSVAVADLNGDGKPDLAFTSYERNGNDPLNGVVGTLLGNGDGTFQSAIDYGQGSLFGFALTATDLNGDGKPDLAVVRDFNLTVFLNIVSGYHFGTTTSVVSSENPAPQFQAVTFTATVAALGPGVPTGSVTFYDGSTSIGAADLNGSQPDQASITTSSLSAGTHSISASYGGDPNFLTSTSASLQQVITSVGPTITTQPANQTIGLGQAATLSVVATGTAPLSYQWYQGQSADTSNLIAGATSSSYTTPALTSTTSYWVRVSNVGGSANSLTATITVNIPVMITTQPASQTINPGQMATLSVVATGTFPLSYQWYQGASGTLTNPIAGAMASSYTTPALTTTTSYWVLVSNVAGSVNSNTATVTMAQAPTCAPALQGTADPLTITAVANCADPQSESLTTTINWGDGSSPTTGSGGSPTASHTYAQAGTYIVAVTSTDTSALQGTVSVSMTLAGAVQGPPPLTPGQSGSFPATLPPGPTNLSVQFVCTSVTDSQGNVKQASDLGITCTSPVIPLSGTAQNITITINTTGAGAAKSALSGFGSGMTALWLPIPAIFLIGVNFGSVRRSRRFISRCVLLAMLGALIGLLVACGGGFSLPQVTSSTTPAGSYTVTAIDNPVNSSSTTGFIQTSLIVPLTVNPTN